METLITKTKYFKNGKPLTGFTIVELIIVIAVFMFIIGAAISIFISIFQHQKRVLSEQEFINQISYVEEYMSKALRVAKVAQTSFDTECLGESNAGYIYLLTRYDQALGTYRGIKFVNQTSTDTSGNPLCQEFFLDNTTDSSRPVLKELKNSSNDNDAVALTSSNLQINYIKFAINGSDGSSQGCVNTDQCGALVSDSVQPRVTILLNISMQGDSQLTKTTCSQTTDCLANNACDLSTHLCVPTRTIQTTVSQRNLKVQ